MARVSCQKSSVQHLHDAPLQGRLLPSTILSLRTSVAAVLRHWVYDPAADPHFKLLVRAFRLERPVQRRIMPKWYLHLVLLPLSPNWARGVLSSSGGRAGGRDHFTVTALTGAALIRSRSNLVGTNLGAGPRTSSFLGDMAR